MKFKLDENIGRRGLEFLTSSGHDVKTARGQELGGATDEELFKACAVEGRALVISIEILAKCCASRQRKLQAWSFWKSARTRHFEPFSTA